MKTDLTDLTKYGDNELTLWFNNDEGLYRELLRAVKRDDFGYLVNIADELFIYTPEQLQEFENDFAELQTEEEN